MAINKYFAAKTGQELATAIIDKFSDYRSWLRNTGYASRVTKSYELFYGLSQSGAFELEKDKDDITRINVNHFKSLIRRTHLLVTEAKLAYVPRSLNADTKSSISTDLARGIVNYYNEDKHLGQTLSDAVLGALLHSESYVYAPWDAEEGAELAVDGQQVIKQGDQKFECLSLFNVARSTKNQNSDWYIVRTLVSKHSLAAQYPTVAEKIHGASCTDNDMIDQPFSRVTVIDDPDSDDYCWQYELYHKRTQHLPAGVYAKVVGETLLDYSPLLYPEMPVYRLTCSKIWDSVFADSVSTELVSLQQAIDHLASASLTNNLNNSLQLIYCQDPNLITKRLDNGQILVTASTPPSALNLTATSPETANLIQYLQNQQQLISGISDVARGNPQASLKSGASISIVLAQAIQFVSDLQKNYAALAADVATCLLNNIKHFATEELTAYIVGSSKKGQVKKFRSEDLLDIDRVSIELANPLTQSYAGRQELLQNWMQYGVVKSPKSVVNFLNTGNLDSIISDDFSDNTLVESENESLRNGQQPPVLITDLHSEHIQSHKHLLSDADARNDATLVGVVLSHIAEHINLMRQTPPDVAAALAGQLLPPSPNAPGQVPPQQPEQPIPGQEQPPIDQEQ